MNSVYDRDPETITRTKSWVLLSKSRFVSLVNQTRHRKSLDAPTGSGDRICSRRGSESTARLGFIPPTKPIRPSHGRGPPSPVAAPPAGPRPRRHTHSGPRRPRRGRGRSAAALSATSVATPPSVPRTTPSKVSQPVSPLQLPHLPSCGSIDRPLRCGL